MSKVGYFCMFLFLAIEARKMCYTIFQMEKTPFQAIKQEVEKVEKLRFFQRGYQSMVLVQNWPFLHVFIFGNRGQDNVFYDILEGINPFLGYKNKKLKKSKNRDFSKGVISPWFMSKVGHFCMFLFLAIEARKMFYTIFQMGKTPFQAVETRG